MAITNFNKLTLAEQVALVQAFGKGEFHTITYRKRVSLAAKYADVVIETLSVIQGRFNLEYGDNLSMVAEAHENGMGYGTLKGFTEVVENILYENEKSKAKAFRFFPFNGSHHSKRYFKNGVETTLEQLLAEGYPKSSLVRSGQAPAVLMLYASNIVAVN